MAEAITRHLLKQKGLKNIKVFSRGTHTGPDQLLEPHAGWVLTEAQIPFEGHTPRRLTRKDVQQAGLILGMARNHVGTVIALVPRAVNRTFLLQEYVNQVTREIEDPIGKPLNNFRICRDELHAALKKWISQLAAPGETIRRNRLRKHTLGS